VTGARGFMLPLLAVVALALAGCGEKEQVIVYKQGKYQGKPDTKPWDNDQFKGNQTQWETAVKTRNQSQNEYTRVE
jgi:predicted outer membrane protein